MNIQNLSRIIILIGSITVFAYAVPLSIKPTEDKLLSDEVSALKMVDEKPLQVIQLLSKLTGRNILPEEGLPDAKINFQGEGQMRRDEAIYALENLLLLNGIIIHPMENGFYKAAQKKQLYNNSPVIVDNLEAIEESSEQFFGKMFRFRYVDTKDVFRQINPFVRKNVGGIFHFPQTSSIMVFESLGNLQKIEAIVKEIDQEVAPLTSSKVYYLKNALSRDVNRSINSIIQAQRRIWSRMKMQQVSNDKDSNDSETLNEFSSVDEGMPVLQFSQYAMVLADNRANSIIGYGTVSDIDRIGSLIRDMDIKIAPKTKSKVQFIRYGTARDMIRMIKEIISTQQRIRYRQNSHQKNFLDEEEVSEELEYSENEEDLQFSPYVSVSADPRSNSIVIYGTDSDIVQVSNIISQLDVVLKQVRIEVIIAEVALTGEQVSGLESFGIDFKKAADSIINPGDFNANISGASLGESNRPSISVDGSLKDFNLGVVLNKAKEDRRVKILSAPTIVTSHNHPASINVGEARPIITGSTSNLNSSDLITQSTVEYRDIGITLKVRPYIGENNVIQMEIEQIVETVVDTQTIDNNVQPIIGTRRATSFVSIKNQEVVVMAGLQSVESSNSDGKVYLLGDIPLLGSLFRPKGSREVTRELIIFIKPVVVDGGSTQTVNSFIDGSALESDISNFMEDGHFIQQDKMKK